jgi:AraC family transcriptional regulator of adaptative response / DNA-3-methyladenine glycosylase II
VPDRNEVQLHAAPALAPVLGAVLQAVRQGWTSTPTRPASTPVLVPARPAARHPPARRHGRLRARGARVLGQQVTVAAARTLTARLVERFGTPVDTPWPA